MPLILSVKIGDDVFVDDDRLVVSDILGDGDVEIMHGDTVIRVGDEEMIEVLADVKVSAGWLANNPRFVRLVVDAPRDKIILRGEKYRGSIRKTCGQHVS